MNLQSAYLVGRSPSAMRTVRRTRSCGFSLTELLVGIMLAMLMMLGLYSIFIATKQTATSQSNIATIQERQRLAITIITNTVQSAGYYPDTTLQTNKVALPVVAPYTIAGQSVFAVQGANATTPDTLRARFQTSTGTTIMDCQGNTNSSGSRARYDNVFSISGNALVCTIGANAVTLVQGVSNLKVLFGIDPSTTGSVVRYKDPDSMTSTDWDKIRAIKVTLTFPNPQTGTGQPPEVTTTQVIQLAGMS